MGYEGGRLAPWFQTGPVDRFCRRAAHSGGRTLQFHTKAHTPVETGALRDSIIQHPVVVIVDGRGRKIYESRISTDKDYGPAREHGSGLWGPKQAKYPIVPKNPDGWLHWVNKAGEDVFSKGVMHPGSPGAHMFVVGGAITENALDSIVRPHLERWAKETARQNKSDRNLGSRA